MPAAEDEVGFLETDLEVVDHLVVLLLGDERSHHRLGIEWVTDGDGLGDRLDAREHLVEHGSLDQDARTGDTGLARH